MRETRGGSRRGTVTNPGGRDGRPSAPRGGGVRAGSIGRRAAMRVLGAGTVGLGFGGAGVPASAYGPLPGSAVRRPASTVRFPEGAVVRTPLGDVSPEALAGGATLFHEHLSFDHGGPPPEPRTSGGPATCRSGNESVDPVADEPRMGAFDGVSCIVDSPIGPRTERQIANLTATASRSGAHVVIGGSCFLLRAGPEEIVSRPEEEIAARLVEQARRGRWGALVEVGASFPEMRGEERRMLRAVSRAHRETGLPVFVQGPHESGPSCAVEQLGSFEAQGGDPAHLCLGRPSTTGRADRAAHREIVRRGAFIGFDAVGRRMSAPFVPERERVDVVLSAIDAGLEDHVLLSSDFAAAPRLGANRGNGFSTVLARFVPKLRRRGVPDETLRKILVDNPRRWLACRPVS